MLHRARRVHRARRLLLPLLVLAALAAGCPSERRGGLPAVSPSGVKVLLIGIDGATLDVIRPLAAAGELPNLRRLMERGSAGVLRSEKPMKSPALWTTIVTGRPRREHGITDFVSRDNRLVSSRERRVPALWNVASAFGLSNGWVGFWSTWPAEVVEGWMVSDRLARGRWSEWTDGVKREAVTYPPELADELIPLLVDPSNPPMNEIDALVELTPEERRAFLAAEKPIRGDPLSVLKFAWCAQRSYERVALHLLEQRGQPDLLAVFLIAADPISHTFWHYWHPKAFEGVDPADAARLGKLVPAIYRHNDRFVGELLARVDPETAVVVVSDHGFRASGVLRVPHTPEETREVEERSRALGEVAVGKPGRHDLAGVIIAAGGPLRAGVAVRAALPDVAPTLLALLGLPVPRNGAGRVLDELLAPEFLAAHAPPEIASYDDRVAVERLATSGEENAEQIRAQLRALGYIEK